ncbi:autotransporter outer membrane beta-barrel domain-containing protein [Scandinavium sp.]|uniref:autotransporter outer membrane beta-barrel domain-containing protein n=1 Tax=Scandinavium sp. TaxID=2830653 RepID=UPI0028971BC1|nr:autotransporter outer membrane beta-barrel domain-containing protein [Scandinavium sp.]
MSETFSGERQRLSLSCLSTAIILALSTFSCGVRAAPAVNAGSGENKIITGDITATAMGDSALNAHDGGVITGGDVILSSRFNALIRASGNSCIELNGVTLGPSFGAQAYIEDGAQVALSDVTFTGGDVLYVAGAGSQLLLKNALSSPSRAAFDISDGGRLALDNFTLEGEPSGSGAAMIRAAGGSTVSITSGSSLLSHDNAVLKLSEGATAILRDSSLSTSPLNPENIGYYPVVQLNPGTALDADNVQLAFDVEGSAFSLDEGATADIRNSRIVGTKISGAGAAVDVFGRESRADLTDTSISVAGDMSATPGQFMGIYVGQGAALDMQGGSITTDGKGTTGLQGDYAQVHLRDVNIVTQQDESAGVILYGASGDITGGTITTKGGNAPALSLRDNGALIVKDTTIMASSSDALLLVGGASHSLDLTLDNAQILSGDSGTSLVMQDPTKRQPGGAVISTNLRNGTMMSGDVSVTGNDSRSAFSLALDNATLNGAVNASGGTTSLTTTNHGIWNVTGNSVLDTLHNGGTVAFAGDTPGTRLHVRGDYAGDNGLIAFRTVLGDDDALTDRMLVDGNTSGKSSVLVTNAGGSGAKTLEGIELIHVQGDSTGEFMQKGRIVAGAWDYRLARGEGAYAANWYLTSKDVTPTPPPDDGGKNTDKPLDPRDSSTARPEAGAYAANLAAANTLFLNRLHDRLGETHYVDALTGEDRVTSLWMRNVGGHSRSKDNSEQLSTQANRYVLQLGGDVAQWTAGNESRFHLGVMGGYANQHSRTRNQRNDYHADGRINGYSVGGYGTWLEDGKDNTGGYIDIWMLYNWFNNSVKGESLSSEDYKSKGVTTSVEAGYTWKAGERTPRESWYIQPVAQLTWMNVRANEHHEANGTRVQGEGTGNVQSRLGLRTFIKGHSRLDENKNRTFEPFIEANWLHNTKSFGASLNGVRIDRAGNRNVAELKAGVESQLNRSLSLWGNIGQQIGDSGYSDTLGMLGVKAAF